MSKTVDLGPVSAYALAVKHGYEGTEEQWIAEVESKRVDAVNAAADARKSADTATEKAEIATQKAEEIKGESKAAAASATKAQSYAVGGTGSRDGEDADNAQYYYEQVKRVSQGLNGIIPMGTVAFADLPVSGMENGWMYNISDDFTSDDRFNDGGGIFYGKGNNVIWTSEGKWDVTAGSGVTGIKGNKEKTYRQGNVNLTPEQIGAVAEDGDASDTTVAFASSDTPDVDASAWESVAKLTSGEKHSFLFAKISQMFKNVRYLYKMLGTTDISSIGGGTVTGAISSHNEALAQLNTNLNSKLSGLTFEVAIFTATKTISANSAAVISAEFTGTAPAGYAFLCNVGYWLSSTEVYPIAIGMGEIYQPNRIDVRNTSSASVTVTAKLAKLYYKISK